MAETKAAAKQDNVLRINADDLTLGEIELLEEVGGQPIGYLGKEDKPQGKMMVAIAYVMGLRDDPNYTLEQARKMRIEVDTSGNPPEHSGSES